MKIMMVAGATFLWCLLELSATISTVATALIIKTSTPCTFQCLQRNNSHKNNKNDNEYWYDRRNRRRSVLMATNEGQDNVRYETENFDDGNEEISSLSSCPFSKSFPRYRIDLSPSRKTNQKEGVWSLIPSMDIPSLELPSPPWKEAMQKDQLQRGVRNWQKRRNGHVDDNWDVVIQPNIDGIKAFAFLWEECARWVGIKEESPSFSPSSSVVILGLPDASKSVVQNFCEILEWMMTTLANSKSGSSNNNNIVARGGCILSAEFIKEENLEIPALRLERISSSFNSASNRREKGENSSTSPETIINERTRMWVKRILVEQGICPFTRSDRMSGQGLVDLGVPVGSIAYHASFQRHPIGLFADTWQAIDRMIEAGPAGRTGVSSILLAAPEFDEDFDLWAGPIFAMLEAGVVASKAESQIGVVCFHPRYATPDGKSWPGFGQMHSVPRLEKWYRETSESSASQSSPTDCPMTTELIAAGGAWQRRTPHATINVLRADQLEVAESRRVSGKMYTENIEKLVGVNGIGNEKLAQDLERERKQRADEL